MFRALKGSWMSSSRKRGVGVSVHLLTFESFSFSPHFRFHLMPCRPMTHSSGQAILTGKPTRELKRDLQEEKISPFKLFSSPFFGWLIPLRQVCPYLFEPLGRIGWLVVHVLFKITGRFFLWKHESIIQWELFIWQKQYLDADIAHKKNLSCRPKWIWIPSILYAKERNRRCDCAFAACFAQKPKKKLWSGWIMLRTTKAVEYLNIVWISL